MDREKRQLEPYTLGDWFFDKMLSFIAKVFFPIGLLWALGVNLWMLGVGRGNLYLLGALGVGLLLNYLYEVVFGSLFRDLSKLAKQIEFERQVQEENAKIAGDRERFRDIKDFVRSRLVLGYSQKMVNLADKLSGKPVDLKVDRDGVDYKGGNAREEDDGDDFKPAA